MQRLILYTSIAALMSSISYILVSYYHLIFTYMYMYWYINYLHNYVISLRDVLPTTPSMRILRDFVIFQVFCSFTQVSLVHVGQVTCTMYMYSCLAHAIVYKLYLSVYTPGCLFFICNPDMSLKIHISA